MTRLGAELARIRDSIFGIRKTFLFPTVSRPGWSLVPWVKLQANVADHSPSSKVEFKKLWLNCFTPFCASMASHEQLCLDNLRGSSKCNFVRLPISFSLLNNSLTILFSEKPQSLN